MPNLLHISLKRRSNSFFGDAGTGLLQIRQSRADNCEANQSVRAGQVRKLVGKPAIAD